MNIEWHVPVRVIFGRGRLAELGQVCAPLGKRALVVTGKGSMRRLGFLDEALESLRASGLDAEAFEGTPPNPTTDFVDEGALVARHGERDLIVGLGGGSALDAAKGIAVCARNEGGVWNYVKSSDKDPRPIQHPPLPLVSVPSTSGTGSETTPYAVITNPETHEKPALISPQLFFRASIIDPELPSRMPERLTAATGIDTFAHAFENFTSTNEHPVAHALDVAAMEAVAQFLARAVEYGDEEARDRMAWASARGGASLALSGGQMVHGMEHPVSGHFDVAHGEGLAALLPACIRHFGKGCPEKAARVARILGEEPAKGAEDDPAEACARGVEALLEKVGLRLTLKDIGVERSAIARLAEDAMRTMGRTVRRAPVETGRDDLVRIYEESFA